jgi:DNA-binding response OmpR family regulator
VKPRFLVISDDEALRRLISLNINARGGDVDEVRERATLLTAPRSLDALVLDLGVDGQEEQGWDLARAIRATQWAKQIPLVVLGSTWPFPTQLLPLQPLVFVRKPFSVGTLLEALNRARTAS